MAKLPEAAKLEVAAGAAAVAAVPMPIAPVGLLTDATVHKFEFEVKQYSKAAEAAVNKVLLKHASRSSGSYGSSDSAKFKAYFATLAWQRRLDWFQLLVKGVEICPKAGRHISVQMVVECEVSGARRR